MAHSNSARGLMRDYAQLNTLPAMLSAAYAVSLLFTFGAISAPTWNWWSTYTLTADHAALIAAVTFAVAFASSETKQFSSYRRWEQAVIGVGILSPLLYNYVSEFNSFVMDMGDPLGPAVVAAVSIISWTVAVR